MQRADSDRMRTIGEDRPASNDRAEGGTGMAAKRVGRRLLILLAVLTFLAGAASWALRNVGRWLVVDDPLQPARAIVVIDGLLPYRAIEAAQIYRQGWAPEVWLSRDPEETSDKALASLGIHHISDAEYDEQVLQRLGVPGKAIRVLEPPTTNTADQEQHIAAELRRVGGDKVILVTSSLHARRTKSIWHIVAGDHSEVIVRYYAFEPTDPAHWWRATQDVQAVVHELLGLINAWLGFVAKPLKVKKLWLRSSGISAALASLTGCRCRLITGQSKIDNPISAIRPGLNGIMAGLERRVYVAAGGRPGLALQYWCCCWP